MVPSASTAQYLKVSVVSGVIGLKVTSTPVALPMAAKAVTDWGLPTLMMLLAVDSAPAPLSLTVRALQAVDAADTRTRFQPVGAHLPLLSCCWAGFGPKPNGAD